MTPPPSGSAPRRPPSPLRRPPVEADVRRRGKPTGRERRWRRRRRWPERIVLVTRAGCHLCERAQAVVTRVAAELGVTYREVDVDADPALTGEFGERVPVVLVDGTEHTYWRVDEARLRRALAGRRGWL